MTGKAGNIRTHSLHNNIFALLCLLIIFTAGCNGPEMKHFTRPDIELEYIKKIAVLPLQNFTSNNHASEKVGSLVIIDLLSRGVDVVEPGEVNSAMRRLKIRSISRISSDDFKNLGKELDVDAIIIGSIETFDISRGITVSYPEATISLILIDPGSGLTLWSTWNTTGGASFWTRHFGTETRTLDEASIEVVREALDTAF